MANADLTLRAYDNTSSLISSSKNLDFPDFPHDFLLQSLADFIDFRNQIPDAKLEDSALFPL